MKYADVKTNVVYAYRRQPSEYFRKPDKVRVLSTDRTIYRPGRVHRAMPAEILAYDKDEQGFVVNERWVTLADGVVPSQLLGEFSEYLADR